MFFFLRDNYNHSGLSYLLRFCLFNYKWNKMLLLLLCKWLTDVAEKKLICYRQEYLGEGWNSVLEGFLGVESISWGQIGIELIESKKFGTYSWVLGSLNWILTSDLEFEESANATVEILLLNHPIVHRFSLWFSNGKILLPAPGAGEFTPWPGILELIFENH